VTAQQWDLERVTYNVLVGKSVLDMQLSGSFDIRRNGRSHDLRDTESAILCRTSILFSVLPRWCSFDQSTREDRHRSFDGVEPDFDGRPCSVVDGVAHHDVSRCVLRVGKNLSGSRYDSPGTNANIRKLQVVGNLERRIFVDLGVFQTAAPTVSTLVTFPVFT
jgi:hypothetical protein